MVLDILEGGFEEKLERLKGDIAIGHVRYSTAGGSSKTNIENIQPLLFYDNNYGKVFIAHNGNLSNFTELRRELLTKGSNFKTTTDTELIGHLFTKTGGSLEEKLIGAVKELEGAYSLIITVQDKLIAVRDPWGFRPLCLGKFENSYILASESCVFNNINHIYKKKATYERELEPGEILMIDKQGIKNIHLPEQKHNLCIFELIYFARPDSKIFGRYVYEVREELGRLHARKQKFNADFATEMPDSGKFAVIGFTQESGVPYYPGILRGHYRKRTFQLPKQCMRDIGSKLKYIPLEHKIADKKIIIVDDSLVRGTTAIEMCNELKGAGVTLKENGAKEVSILFTFWPIRHPCKYGMDYPTNEELPAHSRSIEEIRQLIGADYVDFLTIDEVVEATGLPKCEFCTACATGEYPC